MKRTLDIYLIDGTRYHYRSLDWDWNFSYSFIEVETKGLTECHRFPYAATLSFTEKDE